MEPLAYTLSSRDLYDLPIGGLLEPPDHRLAEDLPARWTSVSEGIWELVSRPSDPFPSQGWKIHVAPESRSAAEVLDIVAPWCIDRGLPFKYLRSSLIHRLMNAKTASRSSSGKFITVYLPNDSHICDRLDDLATRLATYPGPYVLSDLRWRESPVFVRYGGFRPMLVAGRDERLIPAIENAAGLAPDSRSKFRLSPLDDTPDGIVEEFEKSRQDSYHKFPYSFIAALQFSNGGGVYRAVRDADGVIVVLKEGRPRSGIDSWGFDAVNRLQQEAAAMTALCGLDGIPVLYRHFTAWEHEFLEIEHVPGETLSKWRSVHYPYVKASPTRNQVAQYVDRVLNMLDQVRDVLEAVRGRGWLFGDLHTRNVMVDGDQVHLIDFEGAQEIQHARPSRLAHPAYWRADLTPDAVDEYAFDTLRLAMFLPVVDMAPLTESARERWLQWVYDHFSLPAGFLDPNPADSRGGHNASTDTPAHSDYLNPAALVTAIVASPTSGRSDRLFPGDPMQFEHPPAAFMHGASGVVWTLRESGIAIDGRHRCWLIEAAARQSPLRPGLLDGLAGTLMTMRELGEDDAADHLLTALLASRGRWPSLGVSLQSGVAGIAIALSPELTRGGGDARSGGIDEAVDDCLELLRDRPSRGWATSDPRDAAGLMFGPSGLCLAFCALADALGDDDLMNEAETAAQRDVERLVESDDGSLQVRDGDRMLPYLATGSAGVALALRELQLRGRAIPDLEPILRGATTEFVLEPQLFNGRAGLMATLALCGDITTTDRATTTATVRMHEQVLTQSSRPYGGGQAFPGDDMHRLSMDVATGTAGALAALNVVHNPASRLLPFLSSSCTVLASDVTVEHTDNQACDVAASATAARS